MHLERERDRCVVFTLFCAFACAAVAARSSFVGSELSVGECLLVTQGEWLQLTA